MIKPQSFGVLPLVVGHAVRDRDRPASWRSRSGLGLGDLPERVRHPARAADLQAVLELLAGVPTIVFGYFALTFFTPNLLNDLGSST